ncbi:MAG TPA: hypothetical protein VFD43_09325, partial [Planctomycetota bacterium]|nr:hypothetical protein [Planctomycetota bacterium]
MPPAVVNELVDTLNREYERLHTAKEDAFWTAYMGLTGDPAAARAELDRQEIALRRFLQDPARLAAVREERQRLGGEGRSGDETGVALAGWEATFAAHAIADGAARALGEEIVAAEGALANAR